MNDIANGGRTPVAGVRGWTARLRARALRRDDPAPQLARFLVVGVGNTVLSFVV